MSLTQNLEELLHFLELLKPAKKFSAVVMPDFFLDRLVTYEGDLTYFSKVIAQLKGKKETEVADQIFQNFTNFFEVRGVRDKRHEEGKIGV
jgi:hypothetical protein